MSRCLLYYITDRAQFPGDEASRQRRLLKKIAEAARCGVDYIQLREKDLSTRDLELLAREAMRVVRENSPLEPVSKTGFGKGTASAVPPRTSNYGGFSPWGSASEPPKGFLQPVADNRQPATALLINSRIDIALAAGLDGVHLRSDDISPSAVRELWEKSAWGQPPLRQAQGSSTVVQNKAPLIGVSCHSVIEVEAFSGRQSPLPKSRAKPRDLAATNDRADFAVFAPVFEKKDAPGVPPTGLETLRQACQQNIPVLALGGITLENAQACLEAGAAGIAGIRLFQENDIAEVVRKLRG